MTISENSGLHSDRRKGMGAGLVYNCVKQAIMEGRLAESAPIDEKSLVEEFAVSRTPVREALTRLAAEGLVTLRTNRSAIVAPAAPAGLGTYCEARTRVAAAVGRFAAMRRWDTDIAALKAYLAAMDAAPAPSAAAVRAVFRALANAARNRYLETEHERLIDTGTRLAYAAGCIDSCRQLSADGLRRIAAAVIKGDADDAEAEARTQVATLCGAIAAANGKACDDGA